MFLLCSDQWTDNDLHDLDHVQLTPQRMKGLVAWSRGVLHNQEWTTIKGPRQRAAICCATCALHDILLDVLVFILVYNFSHNNQIVPVSSIVLILILRSSGLFLFLAATTTHRNMFFFYVDHTKLC
jgi:hypothetical protein